MFEKCLKDHLINETSFEKDVFANEMTVGMKKVFGGMIHFWPV